jgi:hypothetical protein
MARIVNIPIAFEFQPQRAKWSMRTAIVRGWAKDLKKGVLTRYFGPADDVVVNVPDQLNVYGTLGLDETFDIPLDDSDSTLTAVMHWRDLPTAIQEGATQSKGREQIQGRDFQILLCETQTDSTRRPDDGWEMRREFIGLRKDDWALVQFLRKWGVWDEKKLGSFGFGTKTPVGIANFVVPDTIWDLQHRYREALTNPPAEWLIGAIDPLKGAYGTPIYPHFIVQNYECKAAIEASITIDRLRKVKFRQCKRHDCPEVFAVESRHKKIYCSQPCAHLESVRKQRRAAARLKKKSATKKGA